MTGSTQAAPDTVRTLLFGTADDQAAITELAQALEAQDVAKSLQDRVGGLSATGCRVIDGQVAAMAGGMLDAGLGSLIVAAWRKWRRLADAAEATLAMPERTEVVTLAEQRILAQHKPSIDVLFDGARVNTLTFNLTLEFIIKALVAAVRQGKLVSVGCGTTVVIGTLGIEGWARPLKQSQGTIDLPLVVNLGPGIPLLRRPSTAGRSRAGG